MPLNKNARDRTRKRITEGKVPQDINCNLFCSTKDKDGNVTIPGFAEESLRVICGDCKSKNSKVAPQSVVPSKVSDTSDSPTGQPKNGGRRKTRRKRRKKRRKSRKMRKKTKRRRKKRRKKSRKRKKHRGGAGYN